MLDKLELLNLPSKEYGGTIVYLLNIPCPPQLRTAIGCQDGAQYIGVWFDKQKVSVNDGYRNFTSTNPGWEAFLNYHAIQNHIFGMLCFGSAEVDLYGKLERDHVAEHGFLLADEQIYLAPVKSIVQILKLNPDNRPDWIKNASEEDLVDSQWLERYHLHSACRIFPRHNPACFQATQQMLNWLESNFYYA
ncbi:MAG: hypothetical protein AAFQ80_21440 [Cyanobacteria bacterium J06621_8]